MICVKVKNIGRVNNPILWEGAVLPKKHLGLLFVFLMVASGSVIAVSSCVSIQQDSATPPSPLAGQTQDEIEADNQIPGRTPGNDRADDLSNLINRDPAEVDNSKLPITSTEHLHITGSAPEVDITQYRLIIDGLVENELALTYETLLGYPTVTRVVLLICPAFFADNAEWMGIPVKTLLKEAGIKPGAEVVVFYSADGYYEQKFSIEDILHDGVFLAHTVNGEVLPVEHGFPLRLVVEGDFGGTWIKWVDRIEVR